jgi:alkylhydroperoxidase family enzyme
MWSAVSRKQYIAREKLVSLLQFRQSDLFTKREKAALMYAEEICKTPVNVPEEMFAELRKYFNDNEIVELTASVAFENYRARFNHALDVPSDKFYR